MQEQSPTLAVKWRAFATREGLYLSLNGTLVYVCSLTVPMGPGWFRNGRVVIQNILHPRQPPNSPTPDETQDQPPAPDTNQLTLPGVLDASTLDLSQALSSSAVLDRLLEPERHPFLPIS